MPEKGKNLEGKLSFGKVFGTGTICFLIGNIISYQTVKNNFEKSEYLTEKTQISKLNEIYRESNPLMAPVYLLISSGTNLALRFYGDLNEGTPEEVREKRKYLEE